MFNIEKFEQYCPDIINQKAKDDELSDDDSDDENAEFSMQVIVSLEYSTIFRAPQWRISTSKRKTQNSSRE